MNFGTTGMISGYYTSDIYKKIKSAGTADKTGFLSAVAAKAAEQTESASLEEMWKSRYPGGYYHVMDGSRISQEIWDRTDFPFEKFFSDDVDESILDWKPDGAEPSPFDPDVISRRSSIAGKMAVIVPPALEEKMKNDPEFAKRVMENLESFIEDYKANRAEPGCSYLIELTEDGEIGKYRVTGPLRFSQSTSGSSIYDEAYRRHMEFERIAAEKILKHKLLEQMTDQKHYLNSIMGEK